MSTRLVTLPAAVILLAALAACGEDASTSARDSSADGAGDSSSGPTTGCSYPEAGAPAREVEPPPSDAAAEGEVPVTLTTSIGELRLSLDAVASPCTVNSFVSLVEQDYFDDTSCHRLTTQGIFVLQCGDPTGTGTGGPGYSFADEVTEDATYPAGTLAMANAGADTNGSQFFIVYDDTELPPLYTVFGTVDEESLDAVRDVAKAGTSSGAPDGPPKTEVTVTDAVAD
jgi:peptidyl-prolyl cis-trans isomerase B (cyclophilin B)